MLEAYLEYIPYDDVPVALILVFSFNFKFPLLKYIPYELLLLTFRIFNL